MRKFLLATIVVLVIALCAVGAAGAYFFLVESPQASVAQVFGSGPTVALNTDDQQTPPPTDTPRPTPTRFPTLTSAIQSAAPAGATAQATPASPIASTLAQLESIQPPSADRIHLAEEYRGVVQNWATPAAPKQYNVGDKETFFVNRDMQSQIEKITATLQYKNDVLYMWVEDGEHADIAALKKSADDFANKIYPTDRNFLGSEAIPGIDNDPHLTILNARVERVAGYFSLADTLPLAVNRQSNQREMFYINTRALQPGTDLYDSVLAHEFAHMIHHNQNPRGESSWITEGFGDLGIELNGYQTGHEQAFAGNPDLQLDAWDSLSGLAIPHYGAAFLFLSYQLNRFGDQYMKDILSSGLTGIPSIQQALDKGNTGLSFDNVFADWVVANLINDHSQGARYGYLPDSLGIRPTVGFSQYPVQSGDSVHQYGTDYIQLLPNKNGQDVTFTFDGAQTVRAIPTDPHSGKEMWWSGRTDNSDTTLTRNVDLTQVNKATLKFWTWYNLEPDFDYAYVSVSQDGGKTWTTLKGNTTTTDDPNAQNYGNAFNCGSGISCGGDTSAQPQWVQETMDLTHYAGKNVLLRFEQVTDEVYTAPGFAIDDVEIPEIGFTDNMEIGDNGWTARGFARMDNILPQKFIVQAIEFGATPKVTPITLDANNHGTWTSKGFGKDVSRIVIAVSGSTPVTWETADYQYQIQ